MEGIANCDNFAIEGEGSRAFACNNKLGVVTEFDGTASLFAVRVECFVVW